MKVRKLRRADAVQDEGTVTAVALPATVDSKGGDVAAPGTPRDAEEADGGEWVDYSNNKLTIVVGGLIWLVVVAANVYAIVELGMGSV
ncbi:hypothetical protein NLJ89_g9555 [Agrocybe chaxingu]|uniref:Uncharacterized protein n=1 Tax=Agrocybe chaxingu TaxID=84603 RepID=A0A9W8JSG7_9AGAR|nr:hypothetical protein NLJ89_g9555 [Agrocybe chaxingu]